MRTTIINLLGQPGASKSTTAAGLFFQMKHNGYNVELVTELAKDITWEGHNNLLDDQLYLLANQNRRLERLRGKVQYIITDSPILLGLAYIKPEHPDSLKRLILDIFNSYYNINFFIERVKPYVQIGRNQTEEEAAQISDKILGILYDNKISYSKIKGDRSAPLTILDELIPF